MTSRTTAAWTAAIVLSSAPGAGLAIPPGQVWPVSTRQAEAAAGRQDRRTVLHVLNRVTFGPRGRDVDAVDRIGLAAYIERQLHPERIADPGLDQRLTGLPTLEMTPGDIVRRFARPLFDARRAGAGPRSSQDGDGPRPVGPALVRAAALPVDELSQQKVLRAIYSERQLEAVLTDFWFNHFNVDARKGLDRFFLNEYERAAIRPHVLGRFRDLLGATAKSPAMLFYLDNWLSTDPNGPHGSAGRGRLSSREARRRRFVDRRSSDGRLDRGAGVTPQKRGLNENYARELMELHTLGVDGGYTQADITEVARAFTGWTIDRPRQGGAAFHFDPRRHDPGDKVVLGHPIPGGARNGARDGEAVLDLLARHPATARAIAGKLARRFVSDEPPLALIDRLAARFRETDGDLREVMRTLLSSSEFLSPDVMRVKTKTPLEFVVSAIRAVDGEVTDARPLVRQISDLGMPLYQCQPPTGYGDTADAWANAGALVARINVAQTIARGGARSGLRRAASLDRNAIGPLSESTAGIVGRATTEWQRVALTLGAPEFQKR